MKKFLFCILVSWNSEGLASDFGSFLLETPTGLDGDTIKANVLIWPGIIIKTSIRVAGVDTPELNANKLCERALAEQAKAFTQLWVNSHQPLIISKVKPDKFSGRYDAEVVGQDGAVLKTELLTTNFARAYAGGPRLSWCQ